MAPARIISNQLLGERGDVVFAATMSRHTQIPLAGRHDEIDLFLQSLLDDDLRVVRFWAPLGTGKTFFLNRLWGLVAQRKLFDFDQTADVFSTSVPRIKNAGALDRALVGAFPDRPHRRRVALVVEEFDRKYDFRLLVDVAMAARSWLQTTPLPRPLLILTGDAFLGHAAMDALFAEWPTRVATLAPLDRPLLIEALARRIDQVQGLVVDDRSEPPTDEALDAAETILQDERIDRGLLPPTTPKVATFRDALVTLGELADYLPKDDSAIRVPGELLRRVVAKPRMVAEAEELAEVVVGQLTSGTPRAMSGEELASLLQAAVPAERLVGSPEDYDDRDYFRDEAIAPLVFGRILDMLGTPYQRFDAAGQALSEQGPLIVGPFIPAPVAFRLASL